MSAVTAIGKNKIINVRSQDRAFGTPSNFGISLSQYNLNPSYCSWHQVSMPNGFYNINETSNDFTVTVYDASTGVFIVPLSIAQGNHTWTTLQTAFLAPLNTAVSSATGGTSTGSFFSISLDSLTNVITLSTAVSGWTFTISIRESLDWILGFRASQLPSLTRVTTCKGAAVLDLRQYSDVFVRSSLVSGNSLSARGSDSVLVVVQNTAPFGGTIFQRSPQPDIDLFPVSGQLSQVNFQLCDEYGHELPMDSNQDWSVSICLYFS